MVDRVWLAKEADFNQRGPEDQRWTDGQIRVPFRSLEVEKESRLVRSFRTGEKRLGKGPLAKAAGEGCIVVQLLRACRSAFPVVGRLTCPTLPTCT